MRGRWLAGWLDSLASPGLIGARFATARSSAWFRWFAWVEAGRALLADRGMTLGFRPERGAPVELTPHLDSRQRVRGMQLAIATAFLTGPNRSFALDALKSALALLGRVSPNPRKFCEVFFHRFLAKTFPITTQNGKVFNIHHDQLRLEWAQIELSQPS